MIKIELQGLIAWLKSQDPDDTYVYTAPSRCLFHQYLTHLGAVDASVGPDSYDFMNPVDELGPRIHGVLSPQLNMVAMESSDAPETQTYGAALERALALQATGYQD